MSGRGLAALSLVAAVGLHVGGFALIPDLAGAVSSGDSGEDLVSLQAADASLTELVAAWDRPPTVETAPVLALAPPVAMSDQPPPATVVDAMPPIPPAPDQMTFVPISEPPPMADISLPPAPSVVRGPDPQPDPAAQKMVPPVRPEPRPAPQPAPKALPEPAPQKAAKPVPARNPSVSQAPKKAAGSGGAAQAGDGGSAQAATLSKARANDLKAGWGATIRSRIERRKSYPPSARSASGTVTVRLTLSSSGALTGLAVARSSGNDALDQAAIRAVRAVGRFPSAPKGLGDASYSFTLPMTFSR
ncbi:MAG: TonB family protein [Gemmobacter sp.]|nr:TonB family protein [Gemmobacter sp.]